MDIIIINNQYIIIYYQYYHILSLLSLLSINIKPRVYPRVSNGYRCPNVYPLVRPATKVARSKPSAQKGLEACAELKIMGMVINGY